MPSTSDKQRRFMAAAAYSPQFAKSAGIPQHVAQEFNIADKRQAPVARAMVNALRGKKCDACSR